ncbi:BREX-1 system phosphatase PglZ type A [Anaerococcus porci]|uniref:BREX-1 system phosphatase PglZ type A n=1 Tax=Anaerococcus porci TaxID=2652269 RepID=UPI002A751383|nr:BREX-1 system phosphatase PglZ type A [Anaerococcus porci]MDY3006014.1 BREX-1 system phosphatase PglZ type A [Anaerococcus porci]
MDLEEILKDLQKRFKKPYPEFYNRRIIFWMDRDREFEDEIDNLQIPDVKVIKMSENNKFRVKKLLSFDDLESDFLVYCPLVFNEKEDNWIYDVMIYSEEFRADLVSMQINEMNLVDSVAVRRFVKFYKKFFNAKARRQAIRKNASRIETPAHLELAIMGEIAGCDMQAKDIIREVLKAGIENDNNVVYQEFINYEIDEAFWTMVGQGTGYHSEGKSLEDLSVHILLTATSRNINKEAFIGLDDFISSPHEAFCFQFIEDWLRNVDEKKSLYELARFIEKEIMLDERLMNLDIANFESSEVFPCVDEIILIKLMRNIKNDIIDPEYISVICDKRRVGAWYEEFNSYYEGIYNMGKMKDFYNKNQTSFHMTSAKEVWKFYTDKFYLMDTYYRKFHRAYQKSLRNSNAKLDDLFKFTVDKAEGIYKHWFLDKLLTNWCNVSGREFEEYGKISEIKQQVDFYNNNIKNAKAKVYVIISDAMRYEVAKELSVELKKDMQCKVEIDDMSGIFPTITPFGMAALLPNHGLQTEIRNNNLKVLVDGESTDMPNREKVLQKANKDSRVLKYDDLIHMKREERKALVKGMEVVYIYHDQIDAASHISDSRVFSACDKAIVEIKNLVRILVHDFSAVNIMITSDHGFLYTYEEFTELDKVSKEGFEGVVDYGRRYAIMDEFANPSFLMPIKFVDEKSGFKGFAPRHNIRIKKKGGGINFVHGGISLQEMVVPLIRYRHLRNDNKEYRKNRSKYDVKPVELNILSTGRKISNMIFNLSFYQSEMLSVNREASNYLLYFVDEYGEKISDEVRIIADKNTDNEQDRVFNVTFNLKTGKYDNKKAYNLVIYEESNQIPPKKIEFVIDIPFATGEYDFFS